MLTVRRELEGNLHSGLGGLRFEPFDACIVERCILGSTPLSRLGQGLDKVYWHLWASIMR